MCMQAYHADTQESQTRIYNCVSVSINDACGHSLNRVCVRICESSELSNELCRVTVSGCAGCARYMQANFQGGPAIRISVSLADNSPLLIDII